MKNLFLAWFLLSLLWSLTLFAVADTSFFLPPSILNWFWYYFPRSTPPSLAPPILGRFSLPSSLPSSIFSRFKFFLYHFPPLNPRKKKIDLSLVLRYVKNFILFLPVIYASEVNLWMDPCRKEGHEGWFHKHRTLI